MTKKITISLLTILVGSSLYAGHGTHKHHKRVHKWHKKAHQRAHRYHASAHSSAMDIINGAVTTHKRAQRHVSVNKRSTGHNVQVHVGGWHGEANISPNGVSAGAGHNHGGDHSVGVDTSVGGVTVGF